MFPLNLPNALTLLRILAVPVVVVALLGETPNGDALAAAVFALAAATDGLDGYFARSRGSITTFGKLMDPIADKLLIVAALVSLVSLDRLEAWVAMVIIAREFAVTVMRAIAAERGVVISASWLGKVKTVLQIAAVIALIAANPGPRLGRRPRLPRRRRHPDQRRRLLLRPPPPHRARARSPSDPHSRPQTLTQSVAQVRRENRAAETRANPDTEPRANRHNPRTTRASAPGTFGKCQATPHPNRPPPSHPHPGCNALSTPQGNSALHPTSRTSTNPGCNVLSPRQGDKALQPGTRRLRPFESWPSASTVWCRGDS